MEAHGIDSKPASSKPELNKPYIPPHLRKSAARKPQSATPQSTAPQQPSSADFTPSDSPSVSGAFLATKAKWAHPEQAGSSETNHTMITQPTTHPEHGQENNNSDMAASKQIPHEILNHQKGNGSPSWNMANTPKANTPKANTPKANAPNANTPRANTPTGPRHGKKNTHQGKRNSKWISNKEIREREKAQKHAPKQGGWNSSFSDKSDSNPNNSPDHDIKKLVDWEGQWLPGPIDWEQRRSYRHRNFEEEVFRWVNEAIAEDAEIDITKEEDFTAKVNGEMAPRTWASIKIEGLSLQEWWYNHIRSDLADSNCKAWWTTYISSDSSQVTPPDVPEARVEDVREGRYLEDTGAEGACEKRNAQIAKRKEAKERRRKQEAKIHAAVAASIPVYQPVDELKPKVSIYLRLAFPADTIQIRDIWNWHITNTVHSSEMSDRSHADIASRLSDVTNANLPFIVACVSAKGGRKSGGRGMQPGQDRIVGFALADDYEGINSMYRYTAQAEVFVHHDYFNCGIGSCLMDRLLFLLDIDYNLLGGYQFVGSGSNISSGGTRVVGKILMCFPYDASNKTELERMTKWLGGRFYFKKAGELTDVGMKLSKMVNLAMFQYRTGTNLDPVSML